MKPKPLPPEQWQEPFRRAFFQSTREWIAEYGREERRIEEERKQRQRRASSPTKPTR